LSTGFCPATAYGSFYDGTGIGRGKRIRKRAVNFCRNFKKTLANSSMLCYSK